MDTLLKLLAENGRLSLEQLASLTGLTEDAVAAKMDEYQASGIIAGYQAIVNWEKAGSELVQSIIEVNISPKRDFGFDEFASIISKYPEVDNVYLMSGGYDLSLTVRGNSFRDIAMFVSKKLSPMDSVLSTATHFILRVYKEHGVTLVGEQGDERGLTSL